MLPITMTREEALGKDAALLEIGEAVRKLPTMVVAFGGQSIAPPMVNQQKVLALLTMYGFNDAPYEVQPCVMHAEEGGGSWTYLDEYGQTWRSRRTGDPSMPFQIELVSRR